LAINPASDVVLGVMLAADPQKYRAAAERLRQLSEAASTIADAALPAPSLPVTSEQAASPPAPASNVGRASAVRGSAAAAKVSKTTDAFAQLEAFVLQSFIQSMLPKNARHVFGKGTAGDVWRSMLAEKLGNEIARSGQVGIAKRLAQAHALAHGGGATSTLSGVTDFSDALFKQAAPAASVAGVLPYLQQTVDGVHDSSSSTAADEGKRS
jgi:Rod binding domain-containing protein